jgi:hypothetical protein
MGGLRACRVVCRAGPRRHRMREPPRLTLFEEAVVVEHGDAVEDHQHSLCRSGQAGLVGEPPLVASYWCKAGAPAHLDQRPERHGCCCCCCCCCRATCCNSVAAGPLGPRRPCSAVCPAPPGLLSGHVRALPRARCLDSAWAGPAACCLCRSPVIGGCLDPDRRPVGLWLVQSRERLERCRCEQSRAARRPNDNNNWMLRCRGCLHLRHWLALMVRRRQFNMNMHLYHLARIEALVAGCPSGWTTV